MWLVCFSGKLKSLFDLIYYSFGIDFMSLELKALLNEIASENEIRERAEFDERVNRYKSLLFRVSAEKTLDVITSVEGVEYPNQLEADLKVLEKAQLVTGQTKYTHRNAYRQYTLSAKGVDLAEKLSKEK